MIRMVLQITMDHERPLVHFLFLSDPSNNQLTMALMALMATGIVCLVTNHMHAFTRILWTGRLNRRETTGVRRA
jgi:hypothetical protein